MPRTPMSRIQGDLLRAVGHAAIIPLIAVGVKPLSNGCLLALANSLACCRRAQKKHSAAEPKILREGSRCGTPIGCWRWACESPLCLLICNPKNYKVIYSVFTSNQAVQFTRRRREESSKLRIPVVLRQPGINEGDRGKCTEICV